MSFLHVQDMYGNVKKCLRHFKFVTVKKHVHVLSKGHFREKSEKEETLGKKPDRQKPENI